MKNELIKTLITYLEDACAYLAIGENNTFHYCVGKAEAIRSILEEHYEWNEDGADEHIKNMLEIIDMN